MSSNENSSIHDEAYKNRLDGVRKLILAGADVNSRSGYNGMTSLHYAAMGGATAVIELLLQHNADINAQDDKGNSPIHQALRSNDKETVELLLENGAHIDAQNNQTVIVSLLIESGADVNIQTKDGETPLWLAALSGSFETVELLLQHNADPSTKRNDGQTALHVAAQNNHIEIVLLLIKSRVDVNIQTKDGETPLWLAALNGSVETVELLLEQNADVNIVNRVRNSALHVAAQFKHDSIVELLLAYGAKVNEKNTFGMTFLHFVVENGMVDLLDKLLCHYDIDLNIGNNKDDRPIHLAASKAMWNIVKRFMERGVDINIRGHHFKTCLHYAAQQGDISGITCLVEGGADMNLQDEGGRTVLHVVAEMGDSQLLETLLENKADVGITDNAGDTALHFASNSKHFEAIKILVKRGGSRHVLNKQGKSPLDIALSAGSIFAAFLLLGRDLSIDLKNRIEEYPLHYVLEEDDYEALEYLLSLQIRHIESYDQSGNHCLHVAAMKSSRAVKLIIDQIKKMRGFNIPEYVNHRNNENNTALHLAAYHCDSEGVSALLSCEGIEVDLQNKDGQTAIHMAVLSGRRASVEALVKAGCEVDIRDKNGDTQLHYAMRRVAEVGDKRRAETDEASRAQATILHNTARYIVLDLIRNGSNLCLSNSAMEETTHLVDMRWEVNLVGEMVRLANERWRCLNCMEHDLEMVFSCGHRACIQCGPTLQRCHVCGEEITERIRMYC